MISCATQPWPGEINMQQNAFIIGSPITNGIELNGGC